MTRKKADETKDTGQESVSLGDILSGTGVSSGDVISAIDCEKLRNLLLVAIGLGSMVSIWFDDNSSALCFSVRLGKERKSYRCETGEIFDQCAESVTKLLLPALGKLGKPNPLIPKPK